MIVGADNANDAVILHTSSALYTSHRLRRVYYSAFSPIPDASADLPLQAPPMVREHRLYQADWLMRFYGFTAAEIADDAHPDLDLEIDPKLAWALRHPDRFPVDLNTAPREVIAALRESGYDGFFSLEPHLGDFDAFGGLCGPDLWGQAHAALVKLFDEQGIEYR